MVSRGLAPPSPLTPPPMTAPLPLSTAIRALHACPTADQVGVSHQREPAVSATGKAAAQAVVQEVCPTPSRKTRHAIDIAASAASAAAVSSNKILWPVVTRPPPQATRGGPGTTRKPHQSLTINKKLKIVEIKDLGVYLTWADIKEAFPKSFSESSIQNAWRQRETLRTPSTENLGTTSRLLRSTFSDVELKVRQWKNLRAVLGAQSLLLTMAVLRKRAEMMAASLEVMGFSAPAGLVCR